MWRILPFILLANFSLAQVHYGEGQRISTVFKYKLQKMTLNIKLGQTLFYDNTQVKSGSVEGHKSTEVKLVLKWIL
jgi:hypothetical protein